MGCCNNYVAQYDPNTDEVVCTSCGVVNDDETEVARSLTTRDQERQASAEDHSPVNYLLIDEMGEQHDMITLDSTGLAMALGKNSKARDVGGKKVKQQLKEGYVTGQVVGKGSRAMEEDWYHVLLNCKKNHVYDFEDEPLLGEHEVGKEYFCKKCQVPATIIAIQPFKKIVAISSYKFDKLYRKAKNRAHNTAVKLGLDAPERSIYGKEVNKVFCEIVLGLMPKVIENMALIRLTKYKGLSVELTSETLREYFDNQEKARLFFTQFHEQFVVPMQTATK